MKKKTTACITIIFLFLGSIYAQNPTSNSISFNWGIGNFQRQDLTFSPMIHSDWSALNFVLNYERSKKFEQQAYVKFGIYDPGVGEQYTLTSPFTGDDVQSYPHNFTLLDINYSFGKSIVEKEKLKLALGGRLRNRLNASYYNFGLFSYFGYYFTFGLDAWVKLQYQLSEKHRFASNIALPLFSYNTRSPYLSADDQFFLDNYGHSNAFKSVSNYYEGGEWQSWGKSQSFDFDIAYWYALSEKWEVGASYWLSMNFNQDPTKYTAFQNNLYLSVTLKF